MGLPAPKERFAERCDRVSPGDHWRFSGERLGGLGVPPRVYEANGGLPARPHRAAMWLFRGPFPKGKQVRRKCGFDECVNPKHLVLMRSGRRVKKANRFKWVRSV